jgi:pimeloyl-ACP methyl ester carboxylesterase
VCVAYEIFGEGSPAVLFMTRAIVHSRVWKAQVPFLARHHRVITIDGRGNGRSDRPSYAAGYADEAYVEDAIAVLDSTGTDSVVAVGLCSFARLATVLAAKHPDRVDGLVAIAPALHLTPDYPARVDFEAVLDTDEGWAKFNRHFWLRDWPGWATFWSEQLFPEPHSTRQIEECTDWMCGSDAATQLLVEAAPKRATTHEDAMALLNDIRCPVLVVVGDNDACQPPERAERMAAITGGRLVRIEGGGHVVPARHPVKVNLLLREFIEDIAGVRPS